MFDGLLSKQIAVRIQGELLFRVLGHVHFGGADVFDFLGCGAVAE